MAALGQVLSRHFGLLRLKGPQLLNTLLVNSEPSSFKVIQRGMAGGKARKFFVKPTRYGDLRFLRAARYYFLLTGVPCVIGITCINVFVGPAQLAEIPEGYTPKEFEYHKHPITRFITKYFVNTPQQEYEKMAHYLDIEKEKIGARKAEKTVRRLMRERGDGHWYYYPVASPVDRYEDEELKD
ncbi:NADH dehydrogenase [ubiquinone] 1 beta subcomplex subunit 5, mitochondrial-like [Asterias rubens]|uniref:NADH dehydrogenase [ubiquinone] 1 beta subcomplex subunit 5, mitochondrial-like n=1 Tax=Asterias rubens TaxID=7604 RepID=UPI0014556C67|nr:NADH dehydrogenase [ubiquinone] 1 beta subcomplex subunit 5, mitochondrial-like [Asterias rubens]